MLPIQKLFINYNFSVRNGSIKYIVIHDVGESSTAGNNRDYFAGGDRGASADFFIDSTNIIQTIDYNSHYSWAIGDGHGIYGKTNSNSVSMEMCLGSNLQPTSETVQNAIDLTKYLMKQLNIPIENVVRHYDCSHKCCPGSFSANNWAQWVSFKKQLTSSAPAAVIPAIIYRKAVTITKVCNCVNSLGKISTTFKVGAQVTIINEESGYYWTTIGKFPKDSCDGIVIPSATKVTIPTVSVPLSVQYGIVTASALFVHNAPKTDAIKLGTLTKGTKVKIDKKIGEFYSLFYGEHGGFVSADYIKLL